MDPGAVRRARRRPARDVLGRRVQGRPLRRRRWGTPEAPKDGVRIYEDDHGVKQVYGDTGYDVWYGAGYAAGQQRLFLADAVRRLGRGTYAELVGRERRAGRRAAADADLLAGRLRRDVRRAAAELQGRVRGLRGRHRRLDHARAHDAGRPAGGVRAAVDAARALDRHRLARGRRAADPHGRRRRRRRVPRGRDPAGARRARRPGAVHRPALAVRREGHRDGAARRGPLRQRGRPGGAARRGAAHERGVRARPAEGAAPRGRARARTPSRRCRPASACRRWCRPAWPTSPPRSSPGARACTAGRTPSRSHRSAPAPAARCSSAVRSSATPTPPSSGRWRSTAPATTPAARPCRGCRPSASATGSGVAWGLTTGNSKTIDSFIETVRRTDGRLEYLHRGTWKQADCRDEVIPYRQAPQGVPVGPAGVHRDRRGLPHRARTGRGVQRRRDEGPLGAVRDVPP